MKNGSKSSMNGAVAEELSEENFEKYLPWNQEVKQELEEWVQKLQEN